MTSSCLFVDLKGNIFGRTTYHDAFSWRIYEKHVLFGLEYNVNLKEKQSLRLSGGARTQIYNVAYEGNESLNPAFFFFFFFHYFNISWINRKFLQLEIQINVVSQDF